MKKIILAIAILVLIVAVSYIKTFREHERSREFYDAGVADGAGKTAANEAQIDSLRSEIADQQLAFADSLVKKDTEYRRTTDSLANLVDQKDSTIAGLAANSAEPVSTSGSSNSSEIISKHEQILKYYKRRFADLPKDLSSYERRIAINEIREETSLKFNISLAELKQIREEYKLNY